MEEKVDETEKQNDDKLKNEVEKVAEESKNIDTQTAAVNEKNQIVDIESVLAKNSELSLKVSNLLKIGIKMEQIRKIVSIKSNFSVGDTESELEEEIKWVANSLITKISEEINGIVLDENGNIDDNKSREQQEVLESMYDYTKYSDYLTKLPKEEQKSILDVVVENVKEKIVENYYSDYYSHPDNGNYFPEDTLSPGEAKEREKSVGITQEEIDEVDYDYTYTDINTEADNDLVVKELYVIRKKYEALIAGKDKDSVKFQKDLENLSKTLEECKEKYKDSKYYDDIVNLDLEGIVDWHHEWEHKRNVSQIAVKLRSFNSDKEKFANDPEYRAKALKIIARAYRYTKDSSYVDKMLKRTLEELDLGSTITFDQLKELINETPGLPRIENEEEFEIFNDLDEVNEKTAEYKHDIFADAISKGKGRDSNYNDAILTKELTNIFKDILVNKEFDANQKALIFMALYSKFDNIENMRERENLRNYMNNEKALKDIIERMTQKDTEFSIYNQTDIDTIKINLILQRYPLNEKMQQFMEQQSEKILDKTRYFDEKTQKNKSKVIELEQYISKFNSSTEKDKLTIQNNVIRLIDQYADILDENVIRRLRELNDDKINAKLDSTFVIKEESQINVQDLLSVSEREEDSLESKILFLEAKIEIAKSTPEEYSRVIKEVFHKYNMNAELKKRASKYRDSNGDLTELGNKRIGHYIDTIVYNSIKKTIENQTVEGIGNEEKSNYAKILLAGLENSDYNLRDRAIKELEKLYPEIEKSNDTEEFKKNIYKLVFGKDDLTFEEIEEESKRLVDNVKLMAINNIDKLNDSDMMFMWYKAGDIVDTSAIDLTQNKLQNAFRNSKINFSDENAKDFQELSDFLIKSTWINSKDEANKHFLLNLYAMRDISKNPDKMNKRIEEFLKENPQLKQFIDESNNVKLDVREDEKKFRNKMLYFSLLGDLNKIIIDDNFQYDNMSETSQKSILQKAIIAYEYSKLPDSDKKFTEIFQKLSYRVFEKISSEDKQLIYVDEKNQVLLNKQNILEKYNNTGKGTTYKSFDELSKEEFKNYNNFYTYKSLSNNLLLDEKDFVDLRGKSEEEQLKAMKKIFPEIKLKIENRSKQKALKNIGDRRYNLLKREILKLDEDEIKALGDKNVVAIWYSERKISKDNGEEYEKIALEIKKKLIPEVTLKNGFELDVENIDLILGNNTFSNIIEKNKNNKFNNIINEIYDLKHIKQCKIDDFNDITISAIWYNEKIKDMSSMGLHEEAKKLENQFRTRFEKNDGRSIKEIVSDFENKVKADIEKNYFKSNKMENKDIFVRNLGEKNVNFLENYTEISKKIYDEKILSGIEILKNEDKSLYSENFKLKRLSGLYNLFSTPKSEESTSYFAVEILRQYILKNKESFSKIINSEGEIDIEKLKEYKTTEGNQELGPIKRQLIDKQKKLENKENGTLDRYDRILNYIEAENDDRSKKENSYEDDMIDLFNDDKLTESLKTKYKQKKPESYNQIVESIGYAQKDTLKEYVGNTIIMAKKFVEQSIEVLTRERSAKEIATKVADKMIRATKRVKNKLKHDISENKKERAEKKKIQKNQRSLPKNGEQEALPKGKTNFEKVAEMSAEKSTQENATTQVSEKSTNNQQNNSPWMTNETRGCDKGVAQNTNNSHVAEKITIQDETREDR